MYLRSVTHFTVALLSEVCLAFMVFDSTDRSCREGLSLWALKFPAYYQKHRIFSRRTQCLNRSVFLTQCYYSLEDGSVEQLTQTVDVSFCPVGTWIDQVCIDGKGHCVPQPSSWSLVTADQNITRWHTEFQAFWRMTIRASLRDRAPEGVLFRVFEHLYQSRRESQTECSD
ncbi:hypothetical protein MRB53_041758 [Persea americana]|nr:hypothetical protein MRB53_041758 [Persea americana]